MAEKTGILKHQGRGLSSHFPQLRGSAAPHVHHQRGCQALSLKWLWQNRPRLSSSTIVQQSPRYARAILLPRGSGTPSAIRCNVTPSGCRAPPAGPAPADAACLASVSYVIGRMVSAQLTASISCRMASICRTTTSGRWVSVASDSRASMLFGHWH